MNRRVAPIGLCSVLLSTSAAQALAGDGAFFTGIGRLPASAPYSAAVNVSGDGRVVTGISHTGPGDEAIRWTLEEGMSILPDLPGGPIASASHALSYDGGIIVGFGTVAGSSNERRPVRWLSGALPEYLGAPDPTRPTGAAVGISADGSVVVGYAGQQGFRWEHGSMLGFGPGTVLQGISADGSIVGGYDETTAFTWSNSGGYEWLPGLVGSTRSNLITLSGDGMTAVGTSYGALTRAVRWRDGAVRNLGLLENATYSTSLFVSADGESVVGRSGERAFVWTESEGMRDLRSMLADDLGLPLSGWVLTEASGISADGSVIVGTGVNPRGQVEGWYAVIPEPGSALGLAVLLWLGRRARGELSRTRHRQGLNL